MTPAFASTLPPQAPPVKVDPLTGKLVPANTPPTSPTLGFQFFAADQLNQNKIMPSMTDQNALLQPGAQNAAAGPQMAAANPPALPPMASSRPPQTLDPVTKANANGQNSQNSSLSGPMAFAAARPPLTPTARALTPGGFPQASSAPPVLDALRNPTPGIAAPLRLPQSNVMLPPSSLPSVTTSATPEQLRTAADQDLLRQYQKGSGASQVKNPWGRGLAIGGDILGSMVLGGGMAAIPGSTARNLFLQNMQAGRVAQDQEAAKSASDLAYQQAQTQNLTNPRDEFTPLSTDQGYVAFDRSTAATKPVVDAQGNPIAAPVKATEPHYTTMPDGSIVAMTQNASGKITASTVLKGTPAQKLSVQDLQVGGKPHKVIIDENTGATIKDLGESGIKPPTVNVNASIPGLSSGVTGDEFLSTLPAGMRSQVAAMANGDIAIPTPSARNPQAQQLRTAVMQYDPTYTDARYKGKQNFKTSGDAQNIVQLSTAMEHADHAIANSPKVGFAPMLGNPKFESGDSAAYMQDAEFLTGEVGKLVNGGVLSVEEGRKLSSGLTAARQSVRDAAVNETMDLLGGKARAVFQKYKIATGQDLPIKEFFDPKTQQRLTKYRVLEGDQGQANLGGNPMAPPKQASSVSVTAPDGSVHTFKDQATADQFKQLTGVK